MTTYTVIGYYDDTDQAFADTVEADTPYQAMGRIAQHAAASLVIVGAITGDHTLHTPGDDNSTTAYAEDMAEHA